MAHKQEMATVTGVFQAAPDGRHSKGTLHVHEDGNYRLQVTSIIRDSSRITRHDDYAHIRYDMRLGR